MSLRVSRTAEHVSAGHPDKFCDQVADRILDQALAFASEKPETLPALRTAIECLAKNNLLVVTGEVKMSPDVKARLDVQELAREVWRKIGYSGRAEELTVIDHLHSQSVDIAKGTDSFGAGDQGIMVGYATAETPQMLPLEWMMARDICWTLHQLRDSKELPWLRADCKTQVTLDPDGAVSSVIVAAQHSEEVPHEEIVAGVLEKAVRAVVGDVDANRVTINGTGRFVIGGPEGDAGVVGRKIVVDAYGPRVAVGGGAYSGKDATKVDRSAAYMARHIAKAVVANEVSGAKECTVKLAYGIGKFQPEMVSAVTDSQQDVSGWVKEKFPDLAPRSIIDRLDLFRPQGWSYFDSASYGHYSRPEFPWEKIADV
ncbi:MAG: methionine adenosyltransferase [Deltaproteobacteria bacterium]|nr:methionine adenosyltransferase [Deltaproteobacteria bacterium]